MLLTILYPVFLATIISDVPGFKEGNVFMTEGNFVIKYPGEREIILGNALEDLLTIENGQFAGHTGHFLLALEYMSLQEVRDMSLASEGLRLFLDSQPVLTRQVVTAYGWRAADSVASNSYPTVWECVTNQYMADDPFDAFCKNGHMEMRLDNLYRKFPHDGDGIMETIRVVETEGNDTSTVGCVTDGMSMYPKTGALGINTLVNSPELKIIWESVEEVDQKRSILDHFCFTLGAISYCPGRGSDHSNADEITRKVTRRIDDLVKRKMNSLEAKESYVSDMIAKNKELMQDQMTSMENLKDSMKDEERKMSETLSAAEDNLYILMEEDENEQKEINRMKLLTYGMSIQSSIQATINSFHVWVRMKDAHNCDEIIPGGFVLDSVAESKLTAKKRELVDMHVSALEASVANVHHQMANMLEANIEAAMRVNDIENATAEIAQERDRMFVNITLMIDDAIRKVEESLNEDSPETASDFWIGILVFAVCVIAMILAVVLKRRGIEFTRFTVGMVWVLILIAAISSVGVVIASFKGSLGYKAYDLVNG